MIGQEAVHNIRIELKAKWCASTHGRWTTGPSCWKYFRNAFARDAGLRIDHLLLSPAVADRLVAAGIDRAARAREKSSDHVPVCIELAEAEAAVGRGRVAARPLFTL